MIPTRPIPLFSQSIITKFWSRVNVPILPKKDKCWNWKPKPAQDGYGAFAPHKNGKSLGRFRAHRIAYFLYTSDDPIGYLVLHKCDNPICCNPAHLFKGTQLNNMQDMIQKGRANNENSGKNAPRGKRCHLAKLTETTVRSIREVLQNTTETPRVYLHRRLAHQYNVSKDTIYQIDKNLIWKHVTIS